jgi:hypothetical protein
MIQYAQMPRLRVGLALTAILFPALALAGPLQIRLLAPVAGSALRGGETAVVAWEADALPAATEEWEAFLSIDGGRHYAIRITPHLNIDLRRATWTVPNITARDVRVLLRFGDERNESEVEVPISFPIEARFNGTPLWLAASSSAERGEEARRGDGGVTAWVAGDRDGGHSQLVTSRVADTMRGTIVRSGIAGDDHAATLPRTSVTAPPDQPPLAVGIAHPTPAPCSQRLASEDVLLVLSRLNI